MMIDYGPKTSPTAYRSNLLFVYFAWKALQSQINGSYHMDGHFMQIKETKKKKIYTIFLCLISFQATLRTCRLVSP